MNDRVRINIRFHRRAAVPVVLRSWRERFTIAAIVVSSGLGCAANAPPVAGTTSKAVRVEATSAVPVRAAPKPAVADPSFRASPFYVAAEGLPGTPEYPTDLHLCVVEGAVFLCGTGLIENNGRFEANPSGLAKEGQYGGFKNEPVGRLPDDVWTVTYRWQDGDPPVPNPADLLRYTGGKWQRIARFGPGWEWHVFDFEVSPWTPGNALVVERTSWVKRVPFKLQSFGNGKPPPLPKRRLERGMPVLRSAEFLQGYANGAVVVVGVDARDAELVEIWDDPRRPSRVVKLSADTQCHPRSLYAPEPGDITLVGVREDHPCAVQIKNGEATVLPIPEESLRASVPAEPKRYAREPDGTEWIVFGSGDFGCGYPCQAKHRGSLWRRSPGRQWERVQLPYAKYSIKSGAELQPLDLRVAGDEVWVEAHYVEQGWMDRGVVLRTKPPVEVCWLGSLSEPCTDSPGPPKPEWRL